MNIEVKVLKLEHYDENLPLLKYETLQAAGADIRACFLDKKGINIAAGKRVLIPTGMAFEIPKGFEIQVRPRSGMSFKTPLMVLNSPGTIDSDYRGEIKIIMGNMGTDDYFIEHGERVAQLVIAPVTQASFTLVEQLGKTQRGSAGFGSTGKH